MLAGGSGARLYRIRSSGSKGELYLNVCFRDFVRVTCAQFLSNLRKHASENFEHEVFMQAASSARNDPDLVVQSLDEAQGDFVLRLAVAAPRLTSPALYGKAQRDITSDANTCAAVRASEVARRGLWGCQKLRRGSSERLRAFA
jgi:hypothetical protein